MANQKPRLFVGSSVESLEIAEAILYNLEYVAEVTPWSAGIFSPSTTALDSLITALETFDFAVFVFSPDDVLQIRNQQVSVARDNVIFELGLFVGRLGKRRCFIVVPRNDPDLHLPTDLVGFTPGTYEPDRSDQNWRAALTFACVDVKAVIKELGFVNRSTLPAKGDQQHGN